MTSVVVVSAGLSNPSSTRLLADRLAAATTQALEEVDVTTVELRDLAHELTDHLLTGFPGPHLAAAIDAVRRADGLVVVTPVFSASYSGLFMTSRGGTLKIPRRKRSLVTHSSPIQEEAIAA
ncbi:NAD(P)H-dependent oxidoreductase [Nocardioides sp. NPDC092400]|uniref:NAD(P)H-dependent oxidoreductase n=1 Tax=Nocardioides sp. NPDC092400 TaxID=3155196 RepID=UPI003432D126